MLVQFLKGNPTGELAILDKLEQVTVLRQTEQLGFTFRMNEQQKQHAAQVQQQLFEQARRQMQQYDLLIPDHAWDSPMVRQLIATLKSRAFREKMEAMGGYTLDRPGEIIDLGY